jgi:hypothetical protein
MKLIDHGETVLIVISGELAPGAADYSAAERLRAAIDQRGAGHPYRRALVVSDLAWFDTAIFHESPTIAVGGPGVNGVAGRFGSELPTVWTDREQVVIQADYRDGPHRASLWGMNSEQTGAAVDAFISRGWLDEFLDHCWRFRAGAFA